jgi:hypothetical protein
MHARVNPRDQTTGRLRLGPTGPFDRPFVGTRLTALVRRFSARLASKRNRLETSPGYGRLSTDWTGVARDGRFPLSR